MFHQFFFFLLLAATPWGQVPILEVDGEVLAQSNTIARFLGRKFQLCGESDWEAAKCDEYVDATNDLFERKKFWIYGTLPNFNPFDNFISEIFYFPNLCISLHLHLVFYFHTISDSLIW